jgi:hypothetical protein
MLGAVSELQGLLLGLVKLAQPLSLWHRRIRSVFGILRLLHSVLYASFASIVISDLNSLETGQPSFAFCAIS